MTRATIATRMSYVGYNSIVGLTIAGYGRVRFCIQKFPEHCGAAILYDMQVTMNIRPTVSDKKAYQEVTSWLLNNTKKDVNTQRSRIIATDRKGGCIDALARSCPEWRKSNPTVNKLTGRQIYVYWLDRR